MKFNRKYGKVKAMERILDWNKYLDTAAKMVSEGIVMLKNDNNAKNWLKITVIQNKILEAFMCQDSLLGQG